MIVLDTNVISALMMERPPLVVAEWLDRQPVVSVWTTSVTIFEIRFGLNSMTAGRRRSRQLNAFEQILANVIEHRLAPFDNDAAQRAAELAVERRRMGRPGDLRDTMIAGIVLASHAILATRNARHFADIVSSVVNPWET